MTDHAISVDKNSPFWLSNDLWRAIASFLDNEDLAKFRQLCNTAKFVGSDAITLQSLYNRLYAIDKTLSPLLPQKDTLSAFQQAFKKVQERQQAEIDYLTKHHHQWVQKSGYKQVCNKNSSVSLKSLEARNEALDNLNSEIIKAKINVNSTHLNLRSAGITRLPVALFQVPDYADYWQSLTDLECSSNALTVLNLQGLVALQNLDCGYNQLSVLNVQGLVALQKLLCYSNNLLVLNLQGLLALQELSCSTNQLTRLNLQGLVTLQKLDCSHNKVTALNLQGLAVLQQLGFYGNPLMDLNLTDVHTSTKNEHADLERALLFNQLKQADSAEARQVVIARLGADYTHENYLTYTPEYIANSSADDTHENYLTYSPEYVATYSPEYVAPEYIARPRADYTGENGLTYCPEYAVNLSDFDWIHNLNSSDSSQATAYLPPFKANDSSSPNDLKMSRNDDAAQMNELEGNHQPLFNPARKLDCHGTPLMDLNLTGGHAKTKNEPAEPKTRLLFNQLSQADSAEAKLKVITRPGADDTHENCLTYCPAYEPSLSDSDWMRNLISSDPSQATAYLPSFELNKLKRFRNDDAPQMHELKDNHQPLFNPVKKKARKIVKKG